MKEILHWSDILGKPSCRQSAEQVYFFFDTAIFASVINSSKIHSRTPNIIKETLHWPSIKCRKPFVQIFFSASLHFFSKSSHVVKLWPVCFGVFLFFFLFFFLSKNRSKIHLWRPDTMNEVLHWAGTLGKTSCRYSSGQA